MVKDGKSSAPKVLSAYPLTDQPIGSSLPYVPQARPWDARSLNAPELGHGREPSSRIGASTVKSDVDAMGAKDKLAKIAGKNEQAVILAQRPTASVTDIPGASAPSKRLDNVASFKAPAKPIKKGAMQRVQIEDNDKVFLDREANVQHFTFPAILWFAVGIICPPFLCCGLRFTGSANAVAKFFGWASIFVLCCYIAGGMLLFAQFFFPEGWNGTDPGCLRYMDGIVDNTKNDYGQAPPVKGLPGAGLGVTPNVSLLEVNCSFMAQMVIDADESSRLDRTLVVRIQTPGTTGDNFGLYVRDRGSKINPSSDPAPAKAWFEFSRPQMSNPQANGDRGSCRSGMCDGVYGNSIPAIAGSMYEARVPLGWYKYFIAIGVFANDALALERPFCLDTCLLTNIPSPAGQLPKTSTDPCKDQEMTSCPAALKKQCVFAKDRAACLGINRRRRQMDDVIEREYGSRGIDVAPGERAS